jgi:hypothetical protein
MAGVCLLIAGFVRLFVHGEILTGVLLVAAGLSLPS